MMQSEINLVQKVLDRNPQTVPSAVELYGELAREEMSQMALKLECANGHLNSRASLVFVDSSKHGQFDEAREAQGFAKEKFFIALKELTGIDEDQLRRIIA